VQFNRVDMSEA